MATEATSSPRAPMQPTSTHPSKGIDITTSESPGPDRMSKLIDLRTLHYVSTPEHLNCPICQCPFINPYTTICGHTFCKACIVEALKSPMGSKCPLDRTELWWHGQPTSRNCDENGNSFDDPVVNAFIEAFIEGGEPDSLDAQQAIANYHNGSVRQRRAVWRLFNSVDTSVEEPGDPVTAETVRNRLLSSTTEEDQSQEDGNNEEFDDDDESNDDIFPAPIIISNITDDLQVHCCNEGRGCDWIGPRWNIQSHVLDECGFTRFVCGKVKLDGSICRVLTQRRFLVDDLDGPKKNDNNDDEPIEGQTGNISNQMTKSKQQGCPHDLFPCEKCTKMVSQVDLESHLDTECDENYIKCHGCGLDILKKGFKKHEESCTKFT
ncbi:unnamed protein product [Ambrosiozyma monospora]|uniref:Unnamed protein product n=1 Tax=Ambrosiozyma monospora TaxID=43982 RepID=A0ACB5TAU3_AMBMO|nr:unnamed protein product [Ambrosiozyma monospora]